MGILPVPFLILLTKTKKMNFEISNYEAESLEDKLDKAIQRRSVGQEVLAGVSGAMEAFELELQYAEAKGEDPAALLINSILDSDQFGELKAYVAAQGYTPADDVRLLCAQCYDARAQQIDDIVHMYDADNLFGRSKRKKRRKAMAQELLNEPAPPPPPSVGIENLTRTTDGATQAQIIDANRNVLSPDAEQAMAEIVGAEQELAESPTDNFDFQTLLNKAIGVGKDVTDEIKEQKRQGKKVKFNDLVKIFTKKGAPVVKNTVEEYKEEEKQKEINKMMPTIIIAAVALVAIGYLVKK